MRASIGRIVHAWDHRGPNAAIITRVYPDGQTCDLWIFQRDGKAAGFATRIGWAGPEPTRPQDRVSKWQWPARDDDEPRIVVPS